MAEDTHTTRETDGGANHTDGSGGTPPGQHGRSGTSRRGFLRATAGVAATAAAGVNTVGTTAAAGIPTPWLHRDGKWMKDPSGNEVTLRGMNIPDPKRMNTKDFRPNTDETIKRATNAEKDWHPQIIRIPVQPTDIGGHNAGGIPPMPGFDQDQLDTYIEKYLKPAVEICAENDVYCIVDYHRHRGNSDAHRYTSTETDQELTMFWETVAPLFAEDSHVLYEVYNEPIAPYQGRYEPNVDVSPADDVAIETWQTWKEAAQPWVNTIREHAPRNPILIGSPRWSQWTYQAPKDEFEGDNLAYVGHVYAHPNMRPLSKFFGTPAEEVPVFMTEFGWGTYGAEWLKGTPEKEGEQFTNFFEEYPNVSWQVWCFDSKWSPAMMDHSWELNTFGEFWRDYLLENRGVRVPEGGGGSTPAEDTEPPTEPSSLTVDDATATSLNLSWEGSSDSGGSGMDQYVVSMGDAERTVPAGTTEVTMTGLESDTSYDVSVVAVDGAGNTSPAATTTAATEADDGEGPDLTPIDGNVPTDPDGDDVYEDLNGNERIDYNDVVLFYEHREDPVLTDHTAYYDFNGNGRLDYNDVVELYGERSQ